MAVGHLAHKIVEDYVRRLIDGRGAGFPLADAIVALGGGDAFAGVAEFDVALEIEPSTTIDPFPLAAKLKWILPLTFSFSMFSKRIIALVEQLITPPFSTGSSFQAQNPAAAIKTRLERAKKGRGASLIAVSMNSKNSYRSS